MRASARMRAVAPYAIIAIVAVGFVFLAGFLWIVLGPGPTDFAGKDRVALAMVDAAAALVSQDLLA